MPVFYLLHETFTVLGVNENDGKTEHGKRNSKLFLLGTFIWVVIFVLAMNLKMGYFGISRNAPWVDTLFYGLIVLAVADCMVMAYTYKSYFGRNLLWETRPVEEAEKKFDYDEENERYVHNPTKEILENAKVNMTKEVANDAVRDARLTQRVRRALAQERIRQGIQENQGQKDQGQE